MPTPITSSDNQMSYGVAWSYRFGAACPACGVYTKKAYKHGDWQSGLKDRYHVCPNPACGRRFKSIAEDPAGREIDPAPELLRFLRHYGNRRGGVFVAPWSGI